MLSQNNDFALTATIPGNFLLSGGFDTVHIFLDSPHPST